MKTKTPGIRNGVSRLSPKRRRGPLFALIVVIGLLVHYGLFFLASVPIGKGPAEVASTAWIGWDGAETPGGGPIVQEKSLLLDAEPLFVPTIWNSASALDDIARLQDETELFAPFPVRLGDRNAIWEPSAPPSTEELLAERLRRGEERPFRLLGKAVTVPGPATPARVPMVEILNLATGKVEGRDERLEIEGVSIPENLWSPLEFLFVVDMATGAGRPLRLNSSGFPDWDEAVARALVRHRALALLPSGYFRLTVGP